MTRRDREAGIIKSLCSRARRSSAGLATPAYAEDNKLTLSGSASFTTNYEFRSISNSSNDPAAQPEFDLGYGMFWAYMWGSNTAFGDNIEIDYGAGISPKWHDFTFTVGGLEYTYPGKDNKTRLFRAQDRVRPGPAARGPSASTTIGRRIISHLYGQSDAIEGEVGYTFSREDLEFLHAEHQRRLRTRRRMRTKMRPDYYYWNAGLTLGFMDHWSADIRYYDTDYSKAECFINSGAQDCLRRNGGGHHQGDLLGLHSFPKKHFPP